MQNRIWALSVILVVSGKYFYAQIALQNRPLTKCRLRMKGGKVYKIMLYKEKGKKGSEGMRAFSTIRNKVD